MKVINSTIIVLILILYYNNTFGQSREIELGRRFSNEIDHYYNLENSNLNAILNKDTFYVPKISENKFRLPNTLDSTIIKLDSNTSIFFHFITFKKIYIVELKKEDYCKNNNFYLLLYKTYKYGSYSIVKLVQEDKSIINQLDIIHNSKKIKKYYPARSY